NSVGNPLSFNLGCFWCLPSQPASSSLPTRPSLGEWDGGQAEFMLPHSRIPPTQCSELRPSTTPATSSCGSRVDSSPKAPGPCRQVRPNAPPYTSHPSCRLFLPATTDWSHSGDGQLQCKQ